MATRNSLFLISLGTPMIIFWAPDPMAARPECVGEVVIPE
jgi:hypothetical protein